MKSLVAFTLFVGFSVVAFAEESTGREFFSWYNGWGSHRVWGVGIISGSYSSASVKCGKNKIKIAPIYDSHSAQQPPNQNESSAFAKAHNLALAKELAGEGVQCLFESEAQ